LLGASQISKSFCLLPIKLVREAGHEYACCKAIYSYANLILSSLLTKKTFTTKLEGSLNCCNFL
ncbi:MAG: hypothetical protein E6540_12535, partial [Enterococcus sp.]|nr:hypothetical protein [Enterococcus sp.]